MRSCSQRLRVQWHGRLQIAEPATTAWAFVTLGRSDEKLFAASALAFMVLGSSRERKEEGSQTVLLLDDLMFVGSCTLLLLVGEVFIVEFADSPLRCPRQRRQQHFVLMPLSCWQASSGGSKFFSYCSAALANSSNGFQSDRPSVANVSHQLKIKCRQCVEQVPKQIRKHSPTVPQRFQTSSPKVPNKI